MKRKITSLLAITAGSAALFAAAETQLRMHVFQDGDDGAMSAPVAKIDSVKFTYDTLEGKKLYTSEFYNDGELFATLENCSYDSVPVSEPTRDTTVACTYTFKGWKRSEGVTGKNTLTYTAAYDSTVRSYAVAFVGENSEVYGLSSLAYGAVPTCENPTKASTRLHDFVFKAWEPTLAQVEADIVYRAQFEKRTHPYTSVFYNCDTLFKKVDGCAYDYEPAVDTPKRDSTDYAYEFTGWSKDTSKVARDTFIYTAVYDSSFITKKNGALFRAAYKISDTKSVYFSQGNLQFNVAQGSHITADGTALGTWRFAENQYDYIGEANENISETYDGWIDLFGWGTGLNPTNSSASDSDYGSFTDWGVNAISNGGNEPNKWRTLTTSEWQYLFKNNKWTLGYIKDGDNSYLCFMLIPETFTAPEGINIDVIGTGNFSAPEVGIPESRYSNNTYTVGQFSQIEKLGVVALPCAGCRYGTSVYEVGSYTDYWSSSASYSSSAYSFYFHTTWVNSFHDDVWYYGNSVRLVYDLNLDIHFVNADGTTLLDTTVARGATPTFTREKPTMDSTKAYRFEFIGWDKEIVSAENDMVYTAVYDSISVRYTSVFKDYAGTMIKTVEKCPYDSVLNGKELNHRDAYYRYDFNGWSRDESKIALDSLVYTAVYDTTKILYTRLYYNCDTLFKKIDSCAYDSVVTLVPPTRASTEEYNYDVYRWSIDESKIGEDTLIYTAVCDSFLTKKNGAIRAFAYKISKTDSAYFSQGNLQFTTQGTHITADGTAQGTWRFAENQYDYIGSGNSNISETYTGWIDLFGWGTSGWNRGVNAYQPWATSEKYVDYYPGGSYSNNLTDGYAKADWGVYNAITNGGNEPNQWRVLTTFEWEYLFKNNKWTLGYVKTSVEDSIRCFMLIPADFKAPKGITVEVIGTASFQPFLMEEVLTIPSTNNYTTDQFAALENLGVVALPFAGFRTDTSMSVVGEWGSYWSSSAKDYSVAYCFDARSVEIEPTSDNWRHRGLSVRLVQELNLDIHFVNADGTTLLDTTVARGTKPTYTRGVPTKDSTDYAYQFKGWNKEIVEAECDMVYTAVYDSSFIMKKNGALFRAAYKISDTKSVYFSQGNLQFNVAQGSHITADGTALGTWRFAENQYDYIGEANSNISETYDGWVDLFGWGTSGWSSGATAYMPWSTSDEYSDYYPGGNYSNNLTGDYAKADWGVYNAISNGGNEPNQWRTLSTDEWQYLFKNNKWTLGYIKDGSRSYLCFMFIPATFIAPEGTTVTVLSTSTSSTSMRNLTVPSTNTYTTEQFAALERLGVVALPCAGRRFGASVYDVGSDGYYWSSSAYSSNDAYSFYFLSAGVGSSYNGRRYYGYSVRLVQDVSK